MLFDSFEISFTAPSHCDLDKDGNDRDDTPSKCKVYPTRMCIRLIVVYIIEFVLSVLFPCIVRQSRREYQKDEGSAEATSVCHQTLHVTG